MTHMERQLETSTTQTEPTDAFAQLRASTESLRDEIRALADSYRQVTRTVAANQVRLEAVAHTLDTLVFRLEAKAVI